MFVFNFKCTSSSGVPHSGEFERASKMVVLSREDAEGPFVE
jgi:hypothetical protein